MHISYCIQIAIPPNPPSCKANWLIEINQLNKRQSLQLMALVG